jgi:2-polyprenyl-3-methyl-5-hydroxy-6-metoxy-1,4-benzoquinol methylase
VIENLKPVEATQFDPLQGVRSSTTYTSVCGNHANIITGKEVLEVGCKAGKYRASVFLPQGKSW